MKIKKRDDLYAYAYLNYQGNLIPLFGTGMITQRDLDNMIDNMTTDYFVTAHSIPWIKADNIRLPFERLAAYSQLKFNRDLYDERELVYSILSE